MGPPKHMMHARGKKRGRKRSYRVTVAFSSFILRLSWFYTEPGGAMNRGVGRSRSMPKSNSRISMQGLRKRKDREIGQQERQDLRYRRFYYLEPMWWPASTDLITAGGNAESKKKEKRTLTQPVVSFPSFPSNNSVKY